jgi:quercetin dioxygenase-like cupin family protein
VSALVVVLIAAAVILVLRGGLAYASAGPIHATVGPFHFQSSDFKIDSKQPTDVVVAQVVLTTGKTSGWHTHPGPGFVIVTSGTLTVYRLTDDGTCSKNHYQSGEGFVEAPGQVHIAKNLGATTAQATATFLAVPPRDAFKTLVPAPSGCPGIS